MKVMVIKIETYHLDEYLSKIEPYLRNIIIDLPKYDTSEIQLIIAINCISSEDAEEERVMHSTRNNINLHLIMMQMKLLMNYLSHVVQEIKEI